MACFFVSSVFAQLPAGYTVKWQYEHEWYRDNPNTDFRLPQLKNFRLLPDSTLVFATLKYNIDSNAYDLYIKKLNYSGAEVQSKLVFQKVIPGQPTNPAFFLEADQLGNIIVSYSYDPGNNIRFRNFIKKLNINLETIWTTEFAENGFPASIGAPWPSSSFLVNYPIVEGLDIQDHHIVISGTNHIQTGNFSISARKWLQVFDSSGTFINVRRDSSNDRQAWQRLYNIVAGNQNAFYRLYRDTYAPVFGGELEKSSSANGDSLTTIYIPSALRPLSNLLKNKNTTYSLLLNSVKTNQNIFSDTLKLFITDSNLNILKSYSYFYKTDFYTTPLHLRESLDGGFFFFHNLTAGQNGQLPYSFVGMLDSSGNVLWANKFENTYISNMIPLTDSSFIACYDQYGTNKIKIALLEKSAITPSRNTNRYFFKIDNTSDKLTPPNNNSSIPSSELNIYPNPAHDYITFTLPAVTLNEITSMTIIEAATGRIVKTQRLNASVTQQIRIGELKKGGYIVIVKNRNTSIKATFIKQ